MLEIDTISWRNFISYGDYQTTLKVCDLGQCLITGEVVDGDDNNDFLSGKIRRSNGAGKSTIPSVIQWVLFGRTMHSASPGDAVINWFTGKDCWGRITFKNGDSITRTRNTSGTNELIVVKDGNENSSTADTLSTLKHQQQALARTFGLDWEIFCGSTFFSQYGKPWMEMGDQARKKALERLLHVDRFAYYAKVAKGKCDKLDSEVARLQGQKTNFEREIARLEAEIVRLDTAAVNFITNRDRRRDAAAASVLEVCAKRDAMVLPDIDKLKSKWDIIKQINDKIASQRVDAQKIMSEANSLSSGISEHRSNVVSAENKIKLWNDRGGKVCVSCEQSIPHDHVQDKIEPYKAVVAENKEAIKQLQDKQNGLIESHKQLVATIATTERLVVEKQPAMSLRDAQSIHSQWAIYDKESKRLQALVVSIDAETNPHDDSTEAAKSRIVECRASITKLDETIQRQEMLNKHYHYVGRAYTDRTKIKSFVFREHVPFINARLKHYLDVFGLDVKIELTDSLGISSNMWGYEFQSGGERKRTDVAFMLAVFDFHEYMYGRQCNVLVLDEVDGRLDDDGIDALINVIKTDLATRVESILIISHRNNMQDTFPSQIAIKRKDRFSHIECILK